MSSAVDVFATARADWTLLRGPAALAVASTIAPEGKRPRWSESGRGYLIPTRYLADAQAACQLDHLLMILTDHRRAAS